MTVPQSAQLRDRQSIDGELADRLEHPEPGLSVRVPIDLQEAVIDESAQRLQDVLLGQVDALLQNLRCGRDAKSPDEDSETGEGSLLGGRQQVIAPLDRGTDGSLPSRGVGWTDGQRRQPKLQSA